MLAAEQLPHILLPFGFTGVQLPLITPFHSSDAPCLFTFYPAMLGYASQQYLTRTNLKPLLGPFHASHGHFTSL